MFLNSVVWNVLLRALGIVWFKRNIDYGIGLAESFYFVFWHTVKQPHNLKIKIEKKNSKIRNNYLKKKIEK